MDIDGLGAETVIQLYEEGLIENIADLFDLTKEQILPIERMAEKSADNLIQGVSASKAIPFETVLFALGIRYVGETVAKKLAKHFKNIDAIIVATAEELVEVDEIGERIAESVVEFFEIEYNQIVLQRLRDHGLNFIIVEEEIEGASDKLSGLVMVVSGVFYEISRNDLKKSIEINGGKLASSVSAKTDYLVAGEKMGPSKLEKAEKLGVKLISEIEYLKMIE
jgi:DNA ligase (NAD+)